VSCQSGGRAAFEENVIRGRSIVSASAVSQIEVSQTGETRPQLSGCYLGAEEQRLGGGETILLVEDEAFVREVTGEVLRCAGYRVLTARNGTEAGAAYSQSQGEVDLLLTDVVLPGETGRTLAERLTRQNPKLKILLVSGYTDQMGLHGGEREECLAKPFSTGVLLQRVRQALDSEVTRGKELSSQACLR